MDNSLLDYSHFKREFVAGGISGGIGIFMGFPMDLVKVNLQYYPDRYKSGWQCLTSTLKENGIKSLYRGCVPPIVTQGFMNAMLFGGESTAMKILQPELRRGEAGTAVSGFLAGLAGGLTQSIFSVPIEVVKCTMQTRHTISKVNVFRDTIDCMKEIYTSEGIRGFFKGYSITITRDVPSLGVYFLTYRHTRQAITSWEGRAEPSTAATLLAGGCAGAASWTSIYPFDVIKTYAQVVMKPAAPGSTAVVNSSSLGVAAVEPIASSAVNINKASEHITSYKDLNMKDIAVSLYRRYGVRIFFKGLGITIIRAFPVNAVTFYFYELIIDYFHM